MDTSETYIKMCKKAEEIQKGWKPQYGDCYYGGIYNKPKIIIVMRRYRKHLDANFLNNQQNIWLPRQDQLQGMLEGDIEDKWDNCNNFWRLIESPITSFEQLWLAFVMKEKYKKQWDAEKAGWIKEMK